MLPFLKKHGFAGDIASHVDTLLKQTKTLLLLYREVRWALEQRKCELQQSLDCLGLGSPETASAYLLEFAPDIEIAEFESRVCRLVENEMLVAIIDTAIKRLANYPDHGPMYYDIIYSQYITPTPQKECDISNRWHLERSSFYRRKKEAIAILGLCLFGFLPSSVESDAPEQLSFFEAC